MNSTNQSHPFRFLQFVRKLRCASWKAGQRISIVRSGIRVGYNVVHAYGSAKTWQLRGFRNLAFAVVLLQSMWLFPSEALAQRTLQGRVVNGTTNRPVAQQKVELLTLGEGMNKSA